MKEMQLVCPNSQCSAEGYFNQKFCLHCGTDLVESNSHDTKISGHQNAEVSVDPEDRTEVPHLNIELQYKHFYLRTGEYGCIPLRLKNKGDKPIRYVHLTVECSAFSSGKQQAHLDKQISLPKGAFTEFGECEGEFGEASGQFPVHLSGNYADGNSIYAFRGRFTINVRGSETRGASIIVEDAGALMMESIDSHAVENIVVRDGGAADISRLQEGPAGARGEWTPVHLDYDPAATGFLREYETGFENSQSLPIQQSSRKTRAFLQIKTNGSQRSIQVLTGNSWRLGRSTQHADVVTALLPATEENNSRSERISREHCVLSLHNQNKITVEDCSSNGTVVSGQPIGGPACLIDGGRLSLAGVMSFHCHEYRDYSNVKEVKAIKNRSQTIMDYSASLATIDVAQLSVEAPLNCFSLHRDDSFRDKLSYLFLSRYVRMGSSPVCGIQLEDNSVAPQHAQLVFQEKGFYLLDMGSGTTAVNGQKVAPRGMCFLPNNTEVQIRLGETEIVFTAT